MITIRELQDGDIEYCRQNPLEDGLKCYPELKPSKPCYTGIVDGKVVGIGGVTVYWEGVGEGWLILTKDVLNFKFEAFRCIKGTMARIIKESKLQRIQATVRTDFIQAFRMLEMLGFVREGLMKCYCPDGADVYLYARVK